MTVCLHVLVHVLNYIIQSASSCVPFIGVTFTFGQSVYDTYENEGPAALDVIKIGSSNYPRSVTVSGMLPNGMLLMETLIFIPGETLKKVLVPVMDDEVALEEEEQYQISLQVPNNQTRSLLGQHPNTVLEVLDDDGMT